MRWRWRHRWSWARQRMRRTRRIRHFAGNIRERRSTRCAADYPIRVVQQACTARAGRRIFPCTTNGALACPMPMQAPNATRAPTICAPADEVSQRKRRSAGPPSFIARPVATAPRHEGAPLTLNLRPSTRGACRFRFSCLPIHTAVCCGGACAAAHRRAALTLTIWYRDWRQLTAVNA